MLQVMKSDKLAIDNEIILEAIYRLNKMKNESFDMKCILEACASLANITKRSYLSVANDFLNESLKKVRENIDSASETCLFYILQLYYHEGAISKEFKDLILNKLKLNLIHNPKMLSHLFLSNTVFLLVDSGENSTELIDLLIKESIKRITTEHIVESTLARYFSSFSYMKYDFTEFYEVLKNKNLLPYYRTKNAVEIMVFMSKYSKESLIKKYVIEVIK